MVAIPVPNSALGFGHFINYGWRKVTANNGGMARGDLRIHVYTLMHIYIHIYYIYTYSCIYIYIHTCVVCICFPRYFNTQQ